MTVRFLLASGSEADPIRPKPRGRCSARAAHPASYRQRGSSNPAVCGHAYPGSNLNSFATSS